MRRSLRSRHQQAECLRVLLTVQRVALFGILERLGGRPGSVVCRRRQRAIKTMKMDPLRPRPNVEGLRSSASFLRSADAVIRAVSVRFVVLGASSLPLPKNAVARLGRRLVQDSAQCAHRR